MVVDAVLLDLDDTLVTDATTTWSAVHLTAKVAASAGRADVWQAAATIRATVDELWRDSPHCGAADLIGTTPWEVLWSTFEGCHPGLDGLRAWAPTFRTALWQRVAERLGGADGELATTMANRYCEVHWAGHPPMVGAVELISALSSEYRLGVVTNGPSDIQRHKLAVFGLSTCFQVVVISGEIGRGKPDPRVFELALTALGVGPESAVMVGDSWACDVVGASRAGLGAIWLSNGMRAPEALPAVDVAANCTEVASLVRLR